LATQAPVVSNLLAVEEPGFRGKNFATAFKDLALTHSTRTPSATSGRQENLLIAQCAQQGATRFNFDRVAIDIQFHGSGWAESGFGLK